ncbi:expressed protein [Phakopsora pachyrhizi]|nr:expressed protein [Phakopsora pachyrhizi]
MVVPDVFINSLSKFDFSSATARIVMSIPGSHPISSCQYGKLGLSKQLTSIGLRSGQTNNNRSLRLECQGSSIGNYTNSWLNDFYRCASGYPPTSNDLSKRPLPDIKVVYPTLQTVKSSKGGIEGGGTLFCNRSTWIKPGFPTEIFYDCLSKRDGVLMHVKMILGLFDKTGSSSVEDSKKPSTSKDVANQPDDDDRAVGFLYVGSHNFTPAAWGRFQSKKPSKDYTSIEISNWELGVVLPIVSESQIDETVPWKRPLKRYGHSGKDSQVPW